MTDVQPIVDPIPETGGSPVHARTLLRVDAAGCAAAAAVAAARGGWPIAALFAVFAVDLSLLSAAPHRRLPTVMRLVAWSNVAWAPLVAAVIVAGYFDGTDAVLLALTVPWTVGLAFFQLRTAGDGLVASSA